jgi:hypothetical protein
MTGAARHIATTLAGYISYDGQFRGAPRGFAAFTMKELQTITGISERAIRTALDELACLFGLTIQRRHHDRHLFTFSSVYDADADAPDCEDLAPAEQADVVHEKQVTGSPVPPSLYIRTKRNNNTPSVIQISERPGSVHQTAFADIIEEAKKGTDAAGMDTQFLWNGFHMLNARNERSAAPLSWLVAFVRKAKPTFRQRPNSSQPAAVSVVVCTDPVRIMAHPAPFANRAFHESDLRRAIGSDAYEIKVAALLASYGGTRFAAQLAVLGQAVRDGTIDR